MRDLLHTGDTHRRRLEKVNISPVCRGSWFAAEGEGNVAGVSGRFQGAGRLMWVVDDKFTRDVLSSDLPLWSATLIFAIMFSNLKTFASSFAGQAAELVCRGSKCAVLSMILCARVL